MRKATTTIALVTVLSCAIATAAAAGGGSGQYTWKISFSDTNPNAQTGPDLSGGLASLYLWYTGCDAFGASGFESRVAADGTWTVVSFNPQSGILNAVAAPELQLGLGGCRMTEQLIGSIGVFGTAAGSLRLLRSTANGLAVTVDCSTPVPAPWSWTDNVRFVGAYSTGYGGTPQDWGNGCDTDPVEASSWGSVKALYR